MILVLSIPFDYYLVYNISWCFVLFSLSITSFFIKSIKIIQIIIIQGVTHQSFFTCRLACWACQHAQYGVCLRNEKVFFFHGHTISEISSCIPNFHLYRHKTFENIYVQFYQFSCYSILITIHLKYQCYSPTNY